MRTTKTLLAVALVVAGGIASVAAQTIYDSPVFAPTNAEVIAQGGSFTSVARGYNSLWTNPAGFARDDEYGARPGSLTIAAPSLTGYYFPGSAAEIDQILGLFEAEELDLVSVSELIGDIITGNGIGAALDVGAVSLVTRGIGVGLAADFDLYGRGNTLLGTSVAGAYTLGAVAGYSLPIRDLLGVDGLNLYVGANVRYMLRTEIPSLGLSDLSSLLAGGDDSGDATEESASLTLDILTGSGLAFDAGVIAELGAFTVGLSMRDIGGTQMAYSEVTGFDVASGASDLATFAAIDGATELDPEVEAYVIPMQIAAGASFNPNLGPLSFIIDPTVHVEYRDTLYAERDPSVWTKLHLGTEVRLFRFLRARAGINQGYLTGGVGLKLLFLEVQAAAFGREIGNYAGSRPNTGFTVEAAIRF